MDESVWQPAYSTMELSEWKRIHHKHRYVWSQDGEVVVCLLYCIDCENCIVVHTFTKEARFG